MFGGGKNNGNNSNGMGGMDTMLPLLLMGNSDMGNLFDGIFDEDDEEGDILNATDDEV